MVTSSSAVLLLLSTTDALSLPTVADLKAADADAVAGLTAAVWTAVRTEASQVSALSPVLAPFYTLAVEAHPTLPAALAAQMSTSVADYAPGIPPGLLAAQLTDLLSEPTVAAACASDLLAVVEADPAAPSLLTVMLHFKGFRALQAHRAAHQLWQQDGEGLSSSAASATTLSSRALNLDPPAVEREADPAARQLACLLQGFASERYGVDIHPGASIGAAAVTEAASKPRPQEGRLLRSAPRAHQCHHAAPHRPSRACRSRLSPPSCACPPAPSHPTPTPTPHHPPPHPTLRQFVDHATGVVIGEQASVGHGCYLLHGVTLGATGKRDRETGRRHPSVGEGVTIGSGASLLGPISVGDGATIGAGATVTKDVAAGATVIDTGFMSNKVLLPRGRKAGASGA